MVDLKQKLPPYLGDIYEMGGILDALSIELDRLNMAIEWANLDLSIEGMKGGFALWERELGLESGEGMGSSDRKVRIKNRMAQLKTGSEENFCQVVRASLGDGDDFSVIYEPGCVKIDLVSKKAPLDIDALRRRLKCALPAHMDIEISYTYQVKGLSIFGKMPMGIIIKEYRVMGGK